MENEFDRILPAQFPEQYSSLCDVSLKPGETLVLGGFRTTQGDLEFTTMQAEPTDTGNGQTGYLIKMKTMHLSADLSREIGLEHLISPARMRIQKSAVLSPDEAARMNSGKIISTPSLLTKADEMATISVGSDHKAHVISLIASPGPDEASLRLRTRTESPVENTGP